METEKSCLPVDNENTLPNEKLSNDTEDILPDYYIFGITEEFTMYKPRNFSAEQQINHDKGKKKSSNNSYQCGKIEVLRIVLVKRTPTIPE